jgi:hypothetical protein
MAAGRRSRFAASLALTAAVAALAVSQDGPDPVRQRDAQKKIQAQVEEASRRAGSTIDAMLFQRLSASLEQKTLEEVADSLRGLSEDQIQAVLAHLEAATKAPDEAAAGKEQKDAYAKHRAVVAQLRGLLVKLDVVRTLDEAANRLDRAADKQLAVNAEAHAAARPARTRFRSTRDDREEIATEQADLRAEVAAVFRQIDGLVPNLSPEQKDRVAKAEVAARGKKLVAETDATVRNLRQGDFDTATENQRRHAKELKDLAAALRTPPGDKVEALKLARDKVEKALTAQTALNEQTARRPDAVEEARQARRGSDPKQARANELAHQQTKAEFATRDARKAAEKAAPEVADQLKPAENNQWKAEDRLRNSEFEAAQMPQGKAAETLREAKEELDRLIANAELAKKDPLAAVKNAAEEIEKLIRQQKDAGEKTEKAEDNPRHLPDAKAAQKDVANKTDEVRNTPLPPNPDVKKALDKAADAQKQANQKLDQKNPADAKPDQKDALKALEDAKKALDEQAAAIEQRKMDIAKLEDAKMKLDELAKAEKAVADEAKKADAGKKADTGDTAKKQEEIQPPTKDAGEALKEVAPDAAKKVAEAQEKQEGAKNDLAKNRPKEGGEKATDAAKKLEEAAKDVDKQLAEKRGQEANDQAALNQNKDPMNAAQQLAKAIEQANEAAKKADDAAKQANQQPTAGMPPDGQPMPMNGMQQPNLAELQKQIAKQAGDLKQDDAAKAANEAAKALEKGDIPEAVKNQQKALDELNKSPMDGQPKDGMGQPKDGMGQPKDGMGQPKDGMGQPQDGMGQPKDGMGQPMGGMGMTPSQGEVAKQQQQLLDATRALQQSQRATQQAQAALQQAQANSPMAVQPQLNQANQSLQQAQQQLGQGQPQQAGQSQQDAAQSLQQALDALNAAAQANGTGMQPGTGMEPGTGMQPGMGQPGTGMQPGMGQAGMQPGTGQAQSGMQPGQPGKEPGKGEPRNEGTSEGDKDGPEKLKNAASSGTGAAGDGAFIHLRKRERDKVQQNAESQFPAEFRELIKQYNINIKNAKPTMPATPPAGGNR